MTTQTPVKRLVVEWKAPGFSGKDSGFQSRPMMGAAESGCCRKDGSPCSAKKFSSARKFS
jgi:hypothetical protein